MATLSAAKVSYNNLSNLSKGVGEFVDGDRKVDVVLDDQDKIKRHFQSYLATSKSTQRSSSLLPNIKKEINLPKTYSTKKGPLLLFSEEIVAQGYNEVEESEFNDIPIKTVSDLQKNVLFYGVSNDRVRSQTVLSDNDEENYYTNTTNYDSNIYESSLGNDDRYLEYEDDGDYEMLSLVNLSKKKIVEDNQNNNNFQDARLKRINRGYSARRYLSNWTRHWDQKLLNNLIKDGKLNEETIYEPVDANKQKKRRMDDDLSVIPPDYRIHRHWLFTPGNLKGYRFFKVQDHYLTKAFTETDQNNHQSNRENIQAPEVTRHSSPNKYAKSDYVKIEKQRNEKPAQPQKATTHIPTADPIKICDIDGKEVVYDKLDNKEKENVLTELLFNSALQNIAERQIDVLQSVINDSTNSKIINTTQHNISTTNDDTVSKEKDKSYVNDLTNQLRAHLPSEEKKQMNYEEYKKQLTSKYVDQASKYTEQTTKQVEQSMEYADYNDVNVNDANDYYYKGKAYMFGKLGGSRWVTKKANTALDERDRLTDSKATSPTKTVRSADVKLESILPKPNIAVINSQLLADAERARSISKSRTKTHKSSKSRSSAYHPDDREIKNATVAKSMKSGKSIDYVEKKDLWKDVSRDLGQEKSKKSETDDKLKKAEQVEKITQLNESVNLLDETLQSAPPNTTITQTQNKYSALTNDESSLLRIDNIIETEFLTKELDENNENLEIIQSLQMASPITTIERMSPIEINLRVLESQMDIVDSHNTSSKMEIRHKSMGSMRKLKEKREKSVAAKSVKSEIIKTSKNKEILQFDLPPAKRQLHVPIVPTQANDDSFFLKQKNDTFLSFRSERKKPIAQSGTMVIAPGNKPINIGSSLTNRSKLSATPVDDRKSQATFAKVLMTQSNKNLNEIKTGLKEDQKLEKPSLAKAKRTIDFEHGDIKTTDMYSNWNYKSAPTNLVNQVKTEAEQEAENAIGEKHLKLILGQSDDFEYNSGLRTPIDREKNQSSRLSTSNRVTPILKKDDRIDKLNISDSQMYNNRLNKSLNHSLSLRRTDDRPLEESFLRTHQESAKKSQFPVLNPTLNRKKPTSSSFRNSPSTLRLIPTLEYLKRDVQKGDDVETTRKIKLNEKDDNSLKQSSPELTKPITNKIREDAREVKEEEGIHRQITVLPLPKTPAGSLAMDSSGYWYNKNKNKGHSYKVSQPPYVVREKTLEQLEEEQQKQEPAQPIMTTEKLIPWKHWTHADSKDQPSSITEAQKGVFTSKSAPNTNKFEPEQSSQEFIFEQSQVFSNSKQPKVSNNINNKNITRSQSFTERPKNYYEINHVDKKKVNKYGDLLEKRDEFIKSQFFSARSEINITTNTTSTKINSSLDPPTVFKFRGYQGAGEEGDEVKGHVKNKQPNEKLSKRTVDWEAGDFDPRECIVLWSYEAETPTLVDKDFADALRKYAQYIARAALLRGGGVSISKDIKKALRENFEKLKQAIAEGKIGKEALEEYKNILKQTLAKAFKRKDLENVEIDDDTLMALLELPPEAFEIYKDPLTGKEVLRIKVEYKKKMDVVRTVVSETEISEKDFEVEVDPETGQLKYRLKLDAMKRMGIPEGSENMFELYEDEQGNKKIRLKNGGNAMTVGDTTYEIVVDPFTGKQTIKMTTKQVVGKESIDDILRLAANMTPEERHKYFQDLLKRSGADLPDDVRKRIINEMMQNVNDLPPEIRDNVLKDLMKNVINDLPADVAQKILADIMKSTDMLDSKVKEQMIKNMMQSLDELPNDMKEAALKELVKNLDNMSSEAKHQLLQDILTKVEEMGIKSDLSKELRNEVLKEMIKNSENLDEETRGKILQEVMNKLQEDGNGEVPDVILKELVKQMDSLPDSIKSAVYNEIKKGMDKGEGLTSNVLEEILKNAENIPIDILESVIKMADKMQPSVLKELVKNLDKLPDELKQKALGDMFKNLDNLDPSVKQELLKNLMNDPNFITDPTLREKFIKDIVKNLKIEDIMKETENMTPEARNKYLQDLLKRAGDMDEETRSKLIAAIIENSQNLDPEARQNLLKNLVQNIIKDLPSDIAAKVMSDIMKNTNNLDSNLKQEMLKNLLNSLDDLPPDMKQQALQEVIKNLDNLSADQKQAILQDILNKVDMLPPELQEKTLNALTKNLGNLSSEQKQKLLEKILDKAEKLGGPDNNISKKLKEEVFKEMIKNSENLDEATRAKVLQNVMNKIQESGGDIPNGVMQELVKQMDKLPDDIKNAVLIEVKKNIKAGKLSGTVLKELVRNSKNLPPDILQEIADNINDLPPDAQKELIKELNKLPEEVKKKVLKDMVKNAKNLDPKVQKDLFKELLTNPELFDNPEEREKAIKNIMKNIKDLPEDVKNSMLKDLAKNVNKLSKEMKKQVVKDIITNIQNSTEKDRKNILKNLLKNMDKAELEEMIKNMDVSDEIKAKMLQDLKNMRDLDDDSSWNSDDERELEGLPSAERNKRRQELMAKKKEKKVESKNETIGGDSSNTNSRWQDSLRNAKSRETMSSRKSGKELLKDVRRRSDGTVQIDDDQKQFIRDFNKLSEEEKQVFLEGLSFDEREALIELDKAYNEQLKKQRESEMKQALEEAKRLAALRIQEQIALQRKFAFRSSLHLEQYSLEYAQQLTRAFVFSYFDLIGWLGLDQRAIAQIIA